MKNKFVRLIFTLMLVLSVLGVSTSVALADKPTRTIYTSVTMSADTMDICPFLVHNDATFNYTDMLFFDKNGALIRMYDHVIEQDVFSANGKTLTSLPYTYNIEYIFDSNGALVHTYASGEFFRVLLPDGTMVFANGRLDASAHPGATYYFPDMGTAKNLDAFCAALAQ